MQESSELRDWMQRMYRAMTDGDRAWLEEALCESEATVAIGTDPGEWWEGGGLVRSKMAAQLEAGLSGVRFESTRLRAYAEGAVGWVSDQPRMVLPEGTAVTVRITAVLHREDGRWRMVQNHTSFGVPNEQAFGRTLPT